MFDLADASDHPITTPHQITKKKNKDRAFVWNEREAISR